MELVILGSGTAVPHPQRSSSSHWLTTNAGTLLLDISPDAPHRMAQEQLDWVNLDAIWISHFHLDHVGGLAPLLFCTRHAPQTKDRKKPLFIFGGYGLKRLIQAFDDANSYRLLKQPFPVEIHEVLPDTKFDILPGLQAFTFSTPHTEESLAIRLTDSNNKTLVYTSDTGYTDALASFAEQADMLIMECSFWRNKTTAKHLELKEAMQIAELSEARTVVLSHLYPEWDNIDVASEAGKLWPGKTIAAHDGLRLQIE
jgi:ribonuclease BN (tRNA processing enzyme)